MTLECANNMLDYYRECDKELGKVKAKWFDYMYTKECTQEQRDLILDIFKDIRMISSIAAERTRPE